MARPAHRQVIQPTSCLIILLFIFITEHAFLETPFGNKVPGYLDLSHPQSSRKTSTTFETSQSFQEKTTETYTPDPSLGANVLTTQDFYLNNQPTYEFKCLGKKFSCHGRCSANLSDNEILLKLQNHDAQLLSCIDECLANTNKLDSSGECDGIEIEDRRLVDFLFQFTNMCTVNTQTPIQSIESSDYMECMQASINKEILANLSLISRRDDRVIKTCANRCDDVTNYPCSCHKRCLVNGDCCDDFTANCPLVSKQATEIMETFPGLTRTECTLTGYRMVTSCPNSNVTYIDHFDNRPVLLAHNDQLRNLEQKLYNVPFTDEVTGITYSKKSVFECNRNDTSSNGIPWKYKLFTNEVPFILTDIAEFMIPQCSQYVPPVLTDSCPFLIVDHCPFFYFDAASALLCSFSSESYLFYTGLGTNHMIRFRNKYCAVCIYGWDFNTTMYNWLEEEFGCTANIYDFHIFPVIMSMDDSRIMMEKSVENDKFRLTHLQCSKTPTVVVTNDHTFQFTCKPSQCARGMEFRHGTCKYDTRLRFAVIDEKKHLTDIAPGTIEKLWQCFLQNWLHIDLGNQTSYHLLPGTEGEAIHVSDIQIYVIDKDQFHNVMRSTYMKSGVLFLLGKLKKYSNKYRRRNYFSSSQEKIPYCFDHYYSSDQDSEDKRLYTEVPSCHDDFARSMDRSLITTNIEKCLAGIQLTNNADHGSISMKYGPVMMVAMVFVTWNMITQRIE